MSGAATTFARQEGSASLRNETVGGTIGYPAKLEEVSVRNRKRIVSAAASSEVARIN